MSKSSTRIVVMRGFERERGVAEPNRNNNPLLPRPSTITVTRSSTYHQQGKRVFIKDIAHYLLPPEGTDAEIADSLVGGHPLTDGHELDTSSSESQNGSVSDHTTGQVNGPTQGSAAASGADDATSHTTGRVNGPTSAAIQEPENPTVMPTDMLRGFHWTFLIRHPRRSIPSYYRCTVPPLDDVTGFHDFMPSEAGYAELRKLFDYLLDQRIIGPARAGDPVPVDEALNGSGSETSSLNSDAPRRAAITVIDADDLLQKPEAILKTYCKEVGIDYTPQMLEWGDEDNQRYAADAFEKWYGFHHDAIESTCLRPRPHGHVSCCLVLRASPLPPNTCSQCHKSASDLDLRLICFSRSTEDSHRRG